MLHVADCDIAVSASARSAQDGNSHRFARMRARCSINVLASEAKQSSFCQATTKTLRAFRLKRQTGDTRFKQQIRVCILAASLPVTNARRLRKGALATTACPQGEGGSNPFFLCFVGMDCFASLAMTLME
jgi:hypothetical protein